MKKFRATDFGGVEKEWFDLKREAKRHISAHSESNPALPLLGERSSSRPRKSVWSHKTHSSLNWANAQCSFKDLMTNKRPDWPPSSFLWPIFMFLVRWRPLVAAIIVTTAKEEVKWQYKEWHSPHREENGAGDKVKQIQDPYARDHCLWLLYN